MSEDLIYIDDVSKIQEIIKLIPNNPGVYQYINADGKIIYVGKAKNLKKRVSSYFLKSDYQSSKLRILVSKIKAIKFIIVNSESDALLLENNLIKELQPRYNVLLKDDKTFPYICIKNESFPRIFATRNYIQDGSLYFGPYTSVVAMRMLLDLFKVLFKIRSCYYDLQDEKIAKGLFKPCLEYHMNNCLAPCIGKQSLDHYNEQISTIKSILRGRFLECNNYLKINMLESASNLKFEEANEYKIKLDALSNFQAKSCIVNPSLGELDVFSFVDAGNHAYVNYIRVVQGAIILSYNVELSNLLLLQKEEILYIAINELLTKFGSDTKECIVPFLPQEEIIDKRFTIPKIGDKLKLLDLSEKNAKAFMISRKRLSEPDKSVLKITAVEKLQKDLNLPYLPNYIECFDNSNIQGTNPVAACVVFKKGKASKRDYRHFHIKTVIGPDDFASMEEIIFRRYKRLLEEDEVLPDLIVIDGGKGQLGAAMKSLTVLGLNNKIPVIGIAKRLEEIFRPGDPLPLYLDKTSHSLKLIQQLRDEAHRFGIEFHRKIRSDAMVHSFLDDIPGLGEKTKSKLLLEFKSPDGIQSASKDLIIKVIGNSKAQILFKYWMQV